MRSVNRDPIALAMPKSITLGTGLPSLNVTSTLLSLKELYAKTNQLEKSAEMKKRYEALGFSINKSEKAIIKMEKVNGVYQIPVSINGIPMHFIFDTGASTISISVTEASFLYKQGLLINDDIVGKANFSDANGNISEGTIIILKTVFI